MQLLINRQTNRFPQFDAQTILTAPLEVLLHQEEADADCEISLVLCDDAFIQTLNAAHRGKDKPTDVLSFPQDDPLVLGDIVISLETTERQAIKAQWSLESETVLLAMHGCLHLLGYDDETAEGATEMRDRTIEALTAAGIALPPDPNHPFFSDYE